jgi:hypothetical protein
MKNLYHFTKIENVVAIKRKGLLPTLTLDSLSGYSTPVVFLCDTPTTALTGRELAIFRRRQPVHRIVSKRWMKLHTAEPLVRFTVRLPTSDPKLKRYGPWLRQQRRKRDFALPDPDQLPDPDDALMKRAMETWWIYFGEIAPSKITECVIEPATDLEAASSRSDSTATFSAQ